MAVLSRSNTFQGMQSGGLPNSNHRGEADIIDAVDDIDFGSYDKKKLQARVPRAAIEAGARGDGNYLSTEDSILKNAMDDFTAGLPARQSSGINSRGRSQENPTPSMGGSYLFEDETLNGLPGTGQIESSIPARPKSGISSLPAPAAGGLSIREARAKKIDDTLNKMLGVSDAPEGLVRIDEGKNAFTTPEKRNEIYSDRLFTKYEEGPLKGYTQQDFEQLKAQDPAAANAMVNAQRRANAAEENKGLSLKEQPTEVRQKAFMEGIEAAAKRQTENLTPEQLSERGLGGRDKAEALKEFSQEVLAKLGTTRLDDMTKEELDTANKAGRLFLEGKKDSARSMFDTIIEGRKYNKQNEALETAKQKWDTAKIAALTGLKKAEVDAFNTGFQQAIVNGDSQYILDNESTLTVLSEWVNQQKDAGSIQERNMIAGNLRSGANMILKEVENERKRIDDGLLQGAALQQAEANIIKLQGLAKTYIDSSNSALSRKSPSAIIEANQATDDDTVEVPVVTKKKSKENNELMDSMIKESSRKLLGTAGTIANSRMGSRSVKMNVADAIASKRKFQNSKAKSDFSDATVIDALKEHRVIYNDVKSRRAAFIKNGIKVPRKLATEFEKASQTLIWLNSYKPGKQKG